ncbi:MAG: extracellular solute-binding protein [Fimbriimonadaceae bacterium]
MARRLYVVALGLASLVLGFLWLLTGGVGGLGGKRVEISFWNGWTGPDGRAMLSIIRRFNKANPDIDVSMQRIDWANYYNKLMVSAIDNRGPQVFVIHASTLPRMMRAGFVADASDLYGPATGILPGDFDPKVLNAVTFGSERIAVPLDIHPQGMYCNAKMLRDAGLVNPDGSARPPTNRAEFIAAIKATQKVDAQGNHDVWGFSWTMWRNNFMALVPQFHGRYFDEHGNPDLANKGNVAALTFMGDLMHRDKIVPEPENSAGWILFRQQHAAMVFDGVYMVGDLQRVAGLDYIGAPIPTIGDQPGTLADSHCLCIRKGISPRERNAVERFIAYLSQHSLEWARAGQVPARISIRNTPAFKAMQAQYQFSKQIPWMLYPPRTVYLFELTLEIDQAVEKVLRGRATAEQALQTADENFRRTISQEGAQP